MSDDLKPFARTLRRRERGAWILFLGAAAYACWIMWSTIPW